MIRSAFERLRRDRVLGGAVTLLSASLVAHGITVLAMPVLTRVVTPADLGTFAPFVSIVSVLLPVLSLRYEWAIPLARDPARCARLVQLAFAILGVTTALAIPVALSLQDYGLPFPQPSTTSSTGIGLYVVLGLAVLGTVQILQSWVLRTGDFGLLAKCRVAHSALVSSGQIGLALLIPGAQALILGFLVGQAVAYWPLLNDVRRRIASASSNVRLRDVAVEHRRFPTLSAPSSLLNSTGVEAPMLMMSALMGAAAAGQLSLALRITSLPGMLVTQSLGQAFYAEAARLAAESPADLRCLYRRTVRQLALIAVPAGLVLSTAPWVFPVVFGPAWAPAGKMVAWLSLLVFSQMVFGTVSCLEYQQRQALNLVWNACRLAIVVSATMAAHSAGFDKVGIVGVLACSAALWYPALYGMNEWSLNRAVLASRAASRGER